MLDHERFDGNVSICDALFSAMEDEIMDQVFTEEKRYKE